MSESELTLYEANIQLFENHYKWSTAKALIGFYANTLGTREGIFFTLVTIVYFLFHSGKDEPIYWIMYCAVGMSFIFFKALEQFISRGNLNANIGLQINKSIQENIQRLLEETRNVNNNTRSMG
jgi:hypothetical protein